MRREARKWKKWWVGGVGLALVSGLVATGFSNGPNPEEPKHQYVGVLKCKTCHRKKGSGEAFQKWEKGPHAKAYTTLAGDKAKEWAQKAGVKGDPQKAPECLKCHVTAYGVNAKWIFKSFKAEDGIQCESCHGPGKDYRKKKIMLEVEEAKKKGLILPDEKTCIQCHNDKSPAWNPNLYTTPEGKKVGFYFEEAKKKIEHPTPEAYKKKVREEKDEEDED